MDIDNFEVFLVGCPVYCFTLCHDVVMLIVNTYNLKYLKLLHANLTNRNQVEGQGF